jgi:integrase/recombinase XerC
LDSKLKEIFSSWLLYLKAGRAMSLHTLDAYESDFVQFVTFYQTHLSKNINLEILTKLTRSELRSWLSNRHLQSYHMRSTARAMSSLKSFFRFLQKQKIIDDHPIFEMQPPKRKRTLPRPLSVDQALDLVNSIDQISDSVWIGLRDKALFMLIYSAGLRISEALSLNIQDCHGGDYLTIKGKGGKFRKVPFLENVKQQIQIYLEKMPFGEEKTSPLFVGMRGKRLQRAVAEKQMRQYRHLSGLPDSATPHALRHSCASHLMNATGDLRAIQELLGHASLSTTQIYTEVDKDYLMKAYESAHPRAKER